jgi:hypothetical protein
VSQNEQRYFLKNSNLLEEIHNSKITYCCYTNSDYTKYDVICDGYELVTPNLLQNAFNKVKNRDYIIIRIMTDEHVLPYVCRKNDKVNLQVLKLYPFKHYKITKNDFNKVFDSCGDGYLQIEKKNERIKELKELIKENKKSIRFNKLNKDLQVPYKQSNLECETEIEQLIGEIKTLSTQFSLKIKEKMEEVLRSHWKGDTIETGEYCIDHGKITDALVYMMITLVDRFSKSGNWSGYTYIDDMKSSALVHLYDVALKFEEIKSNNAFAYLTQVASMKFTATLNSEKIQRKIKSIMLQDLGYDPTFNEQIEEEYKNNLEMWNESQNEDIEDMEDIGDETIEM